MPASPRFVRPCVPTSAKKPPAGAAWLHEIKLDGYRFQVVKDGRQVRLYGRCGAEWTRRLPGFAAGELVLPDHDGAPDFSGLRFATREAEEHELVFFAFDLLHRDDEDLRPLPLAERQRRLVRLVSRSDIPCLHLVQAFDDGAKLLEAVEQHKLEGLVSKRRDARYRSGTSKDWRKVKTAAWRAANRERWRMFERA